MTIKKDPRYDVLFCDVDANGNANKTLGLVLRESGGGVDFGVQAVSPYANRVTQGDLQDSDFSRGTVRTQREWMGGFGKLFTYQETDSYLEGTADTRFRNQVVLGPRIRRSRFYTSTNPEFLGDNRTNTKTRITSEWNKRTSVSQEVYARWQSHGKTEKSWEVSDDISPSPTIARAVDGFRSYNNSEVTDTLSYESGNSGGTITLNPFQYIGGVIDPWDGLSFDASRNKSATLEELDIFPAWLNQPSDVRMMCQVQGSSAIQYSDVLVQGNYVMPGGDFQTKRFSVFTSGKFSVSLTPYSQISLPASGLGGSVNVVDQPVPFRVRARIKRTYFLSSYSQARGYILAFEYKNTTGASVTFNKVFLDCQVGSQTMANPTFRISGQVQSGATIPNVGPTGQNSDWTATFVPTATRKLVEISCGKSVTIANNASYWFVISSIPGTSSTYAGLLVYGKDSTTLQQRTGSFSDNGVSWSYANTTPFDLNIQLGTATDYGDPDTRTGNHVTWSVPLPTFATQTTISTATIDAELVSFVGAGAPVYVCASRSAVSYAAGIVTGGSDLQKIQIFPSGVGMRQSFTVTFSQPFVIPANTANARLYFAFVVTTATDTGVTTMKLYGSERDGTEYTTNVRYFTTSGTLVTAANQSGCVYCTLGTGTAGGLPQWTPMIYEAREVSGDVTFSAAPGARNHTLRLKIKVSARNSVPTWTQGATVKVSMMSGGTEFASKLVTFADAFPNNTEDTPFSISEKWVSFDFGSKTSAAATYTINVTPTATSSSAQQISMLVYGSAESTASATMRHSTYDLSTCRFGASSLSTPNGKLYFTFFSSNDLPPTLDITGRSSMYWHEYVGVDRRIAWQVRTNSGANWPFFAVRFHARTIAYSGAATVKIRIVSDNSGAPTGTQRAEAVIGKAEFDGVKDKSGWVTASFPTYTVPTQATLWVILECDTPNIEDRVDVEITCGKTANFATMLSAAVDGLAFENWSTDGLVTATTQSYQPSTTTITTTATHGFEAGMRFRVGASTTSNTIDSVSSTAIKATAAVSPTPTANSVLTEIIDYDPLWILNEGTGSVGPVETPPVSFLGKWYCAGGTSTSSQVYVLNENGAKRGETTVTSSNGSTITLAASNFVKDDYISIRDQVRKVSSVNGNVITLDAALSPVPVSGDEVIGVAVWETTALVFDNKIECLASIGESLYIGFGEAQACRRATLANGVFTSGTTYTVTDNNVPVYGKYMRQHLGYLYILRANGGSQCLRATNGEVSNNVVTKWDKITVGTPDVEMTALATLGANLIVLSKTRMFEISSIYASHMYNYEIEANTNNGRGAIQWVADGRLYVPIKNGLNAFDGVQMTPVGPEQGFGLPNGMQGSVASMAGTKDFLFAAIDAGTAGFSSVLAWNGKGWHVIYKSSQRGSRIRAIGMEALTDERPRLWIFEGLQGSYITFPSLTDNPYQYVGAEYDTDDYLISSWFGGELSAVMKDMQSVFVKADDCDDRCRIVVDLEADNSGVWHRIGEVTESPYMEFSTTPSEMEAKTIESVNETGAQTRVTLNESAGDIRRGIFVSINDEVRQVYDVGNNGLGKGVITLATPLTKTPASGDMVLPSHPVGKEFRYRVTLLNETGDDTRTPKLVRISFRMQEYTLSRFRFSLGAVIDDEILWRTGASGRDLESVNYREEVYSWMKRTTPFIMVAPDGKNWRVKIMGGSESTWTRKEIGQNNQRFSSVIQLQLDEV